MQPGFLLFFSKAIWKYLHSVLHVARNSALAVVLATEELFSFCSITVSSSVLVWYIYLISLFLFSWFQNKEVEPPGIVRRGQWERRPHPWRKGKEKGVVVTGAAPRGYESGSGWMPGPCLFTPGNVKWAGKVGRTQQQHYTSFWLSLAIVRDSRPTSYMQLNTNWMVL